MRNKIVLIIWGLLLSNVSFAQLKLANIFADDMVLQQKSSTAIWGKADPGTTVQIINTWDNKKYSCKVANDSSWVIKIATPEASYNQQTITVVSNDTIITLQNILIGEVWLCSGQSNMEMKMKGILNQGVEGYLNATLNSKNEYIRYFDVTKRTTIKIRKDVQGSWAIASPVTTGEFSAAAYFFARTLQKNINVPVAIISCNWGGSRIEAWMSPEALSSFDFVKFPQTKEDNKDLVLAPTVLYNGMLNSLAGYAIKGVLWYQGESNLDVCEQYPALFEAMHNDWIKKWGIGDFPIYFAQIAPFEYRMYDPAAKSHMMREAQLKISQTQPNTGMIVLMDIGDSLTIHPPQKLQVGERFAYLTMAKLYGIDYLDYKSPSFKSMKIEGDKVFVSFDSENGVTFLDNPRNGFEIAGEDRKFYPAQVKFDVHINTMLTLSSPHVSNPVAIRYAWRNFVKATLFGPNGMPVSSFRTDNWDN